MWGDFEYISVAKKLAMAKAYAKKLEKKLGKVEPLQITGNKIAKSWWGIAWNKNIESYADYSNRLPKGRSFLKNGTLIHLSITGNTVLAYVQGNSKQPYEVKVTIDKLNTSISHKIIDLCKKNINSIKDLLEGSFPKELNDVFTKKGDGLFPSNKQIHFSCSCPDGAYLCKHVAAALYGVSVRFDEDPMLFFKLRDLDINSMISDALTSNTNDLFSRASNLKSNRIIKDSDIQNIFGIEL